MKIAGRILLCATLLIAALLSAADNGNDTFQKGLGKERAEADYRGAIKLYERVVKEHSSNRKLAAQALFRIAECYRALADAQARRFYEDIVQSYGDQKETASSAAARLASLGRVATSNFSMSAVWSNVPDPWVSVSPDGRYIVRPDWLAGSSGRGNGDLVLHDIRDNSEQDLTNTGTWQKPSDRERAEEAVFSKNGKQIAYVWLTKDKRDELRIMDFQTSGFAAFKRFALKPEVQSIASLDWSTDGKLISAQLINKDRSMHIALISTADGSSRILKDLDGPYVTNKSFISPDGKYIAYDSASTNASPQRDIFVLPTAGGPETLAVEQSPNSPAYNMVMGWGPDGHLFYASDAMGPVSLYALPIVNGKPQGAAVLVKSGLSNVMPMGVTQAGTLYYFTNGLDSELYTANIDLSSGRLTSNPVRLPNQPVGLNRFPAWSPDGKQLAYVTEHNWGSRLGILSILSGATGRTREVRDFTQLTRFFWVSWSPDSRSILAQGVDTDGNDGIYRVDATTGGIEPLVLAEAKNHLSFPMQTPDGQLIYFRQIAGTSGAMYIRNLTSRAERKLLDDVIPDLTGMPVLSPDGRYLHFVTFDAAAKEWTLSILPVAGGNSLNLRRVNAPQILRTGWWTPDSQTILYQMPTSNAPHQYWMIPVTGGEPRSLSLPDGSTVLRLHPDGKRAVFAKETNGENEIWAIDNPLSPISGR